MCEIYGHAMDYKRSAVDWANFVRDLFKAYVADNMTNIKLRGTIELDESMFGHKFKYHRGNPNCGLKVWIFSMIDQETNRLVTI